MVAPKLPCLIDRYSVTDYIPHRPPIVMIDRLISIDGDTAIGDLVIRSGNPFVSDDGSMVVGGLIEHMAQTMAVAQSYRGRQEEATQEENGHFGFIVNVRQFRRIYLPKLGDRIITEATVAITSGSFSTVNFRCYHLGLLIAECTMGLMVPKK